MNSELYKIKEKTNESKQLAKNENKNVNLDKNLNNNKFVQQKITRLPQPTHQMIRTEQNLMRNPQEVIRQIQQIAPKPQLIVNSVPVVRHLPVVLPDKNEPVHEEIGSEEYDPLQEREQDFYDASE